MALRFPRLIALISCRLCLFGRLEWWEGGELLFHSISLSSFSCHPYFPICSSVHSSTPLPSYLGSLSPAPFPRFSPLPPPLPYNVFPCPSVLLPPPLVACHRIIMSLSLEGFVNASQPLHRGRQVLLARIFVGVVRRARFISGLAYHNQPQNPKSHYTYFSHPLGY